jgi:hypothetical protein
LLSLVLDVVLQESGLGDLHPTVQPELLLIR